MLKDEPKLLYVYECIDKPSERGKLELIQSERSDLDPEKFKFLHTYRRAFVGDMQKELNETFREDLMKKYAENVKPSKGYIYVDRIVYVNVSVYKQFINTIKKWFKKKEKEDTYLDELFKEEQKRDKHI